MNEQLYRHLVASGVDQAKATELAKGFNVEVEATAEADVDVERLQKALDGVAEAMNAEPQAKIDDAVQEAQDVAEAVTKGADALLDEVRAQNDAMAKGLLAVGEELRTLRDLLVTQHVSVHAVTAQVEDVKKSLNEPVVAKALGTPARPTVIPSPQDAEAVDTARDLISKALEELQRGGVEKTRAHVLRKAIIQLESGVPVAAVRDSLAMH